MILKNLFVHKWAIRVLKLGMVTSIALLVYSCSDDDEDLLGNWVRVGTFSGYPRSGAVAVTLDGKAYVGTGYDDDDIDDDNIEKLKDLWVFDPVKISWTQKAFMPNDAIARDQAVGFAAAGLCPPGAAWSRRMTAGPVRAGCDAATSPGRRRLP